MGRHPQADHPPPPTKRPLQRTVRILLECILVIELVSIGMRLFVQTESKTFKGGKIALIVFLLSLLLSLSSSLLAVGRVSNDIEQCKG